MTKLKDNASVATVGIEIALAIALGAFFGQTVDDAFGWGPYGTIFFVTVGLGAAVKAIIRTAKIIERELADDPADAGGRPLQTARFDRRWS